MPDPRLAYVDAEQPRRVCPAGSFITLNAHTLELDDDHDELALDHPDPAERGRSLRKLLGGRAGR